MKVGAEPKLAGSNEVSEDPKVDRLDCTVQNPLAIAVVIVPRPLLSGPCVSDLYQNPVRAVVRRPLTGSGILLERPKGRCSSVSVSSIALARCM